MSTPRVLITLDPHGLLPKQSGAIVVERIADYVPACLAIRQALRKTGKSKLELRVHQTTVGSWLREWTKSYSSDYIQIRTYTSRDALQERWGIEIPRQYENEILRSGLLELQVTPREGQSFENVVLEHFYHEFFAYPVFPAEHFARLLNHVDQARWDANAKFPLVLRIFRQRLEQWTIKETSEARRTLIGRLAREINDLRQSFAFYKLLRGYPAELLLKVLGEEGEVFRRAQLDTEPLILQGIDLSAVIIEIEYYLNEQLPNLTDVSTFMSVLNQMSGHLLAEFNYVDSFLGTRAEWLTADLVRLIERRFVPLRSGLGSRLAQLRSLIVVEPPAEPRKDWGPLDWLNWVANQYMPYHRWLELQRRYNEQAASYAEEFADWYYENFIDLKHGTPDYFAFSALYNDRQAFTEGNAVALVILLDNLNYSFFPELRRLFNQQSISLIAEQPVFVLPPAATEVGKASLIAVSGDLTSIDAKDYRKLVDDVWGKLLSQNGKTATYLATIGELQSLTERAHDVYFLNYLPVDEALHESSQKIGMDHTERIHSLLQKMAESVLEFAHRFQIENRLLVYIVSDHGSTRIGKDVINVLDKKYYKNIADLQHHRYLTISDKQLSEIPQQVSAQCYIIDRKKFKTHQNYLAARRYYRFVETSEDFYVHGGLTPEEIVVPFARFSLQPLNVLPPTLRLLKAQYRYAVKSIVELEVGNPNEFPLENVSILLPGQDSEEILFVTLSPKILVPAAFQTVFRKEAGLGSSRDLVVRVHYECQERSFQPIDNTFPINLKGVMEVKDDFDL